MLGVAVAQEQRVERPVARPAARVVVRGVVPGAIALPTGQPRDGLTANPVK